MPISVLEEAFEIALDDIKACDTPEGMIAGTHHFVDVWARDAFFASLGSAKHFPELTRRTLETFFNYQRRDGLIPYRVMRSSIIPTKYVGEPLYINNPRPNFRSRQSGGIVPDGGLTTIIGLRTYVGQTNDLDFLNANMEKAHKAMSYYMKKHDGLISEWFLCGWMDAVLKVGKTFYTNLLYWKALKCMSELCNKANSPDLYEKHTEKIRNEVYGLFWNGEYFSDWHDYKTHHYFATYENLLAITWGLIRSGKDRKKIFKFINENLNITFTIPNSHPKYSLWRIFIINYLSLSPFYHNGAEWLQPGIIYSLILERNHYHKQANQMLTKIAENIVKNGHVYELFEPDGKPRDRIIYNSEGPFAWSAGLFLWAYHEIVTRPNRNLSCDLRQEP